MTKKFTGLLFFIIYSIVGIAVPAVQFSYAGHALETNYQIPAGEENENPQQESELSGVEEESEFCHRYSFSLHHMRNEKPVLNLSCFAPDPGTCNPFGEIHTPPPKSI
jgi:hypothetical protein